MNSDVVASDFGLKSFPGTKNWFAVFTVPRNEKRVAEHFRIREIESFLPLFESQRRWRDGSKPVLQLPLFPCYIFVRIDRRMRVSVLEVPGVIMIVGSMRQALQVPDSYIQVLREGLRQGKIEAHECLHVEAGAKVRIRSGLMAGMEGVLIRKKNSFRVLLTLEMIMKSMTVEIGMDDIEHIN